MAGTSSSNQTSTSIMKDVTEVVSSIEGKLCQTNPILSKCSIFRVPNQLRRHNEKCFEPEFVSIGPFHHNDDKLQSMQKIKLWYLHCLLNRAPTGTTTLKCFVENIGRIEQKCRACYAGEINFSEKEFIEMMIIDGCFIIEFFRKASKELQPEEEDLVFNSSLMTSQIRNDLFMLENQLPWCVLELLFSLTESEAQQRSLPNLVSGLLTLDHSLDLLTLDHNLENKHLLDWLRNGFVGSFKGTFDGTFKWKKGRDGQFECPNRYPIPSVEELTQAGVKLRKGVENNGPSVTFIGGVMTIPPICIVENTESVFRNLVAFEQCDSSQDHKVSSYVSLLRDLIRTNKDVDFLKQMGILNIFLSTEDTTSFFNRLGSDVAIHGNFLYSNLYAQVRAYRLRSWPAWRHVLMRDFLDTPKARLSLYFAIMSLYLSLIQTIDAFLPSNRGK